MQIGLGSEDQVVALSQVADARIQRLRPVGQKQPEPGRLGEGPGLGDPDRLDTAGLVPQTRHIGENHRIATKIEMKLQNVPGRPGLVGDDGDLAFGQGVEQGRLADIGRADQGHPKAFAQTRATGRRGQMIPDLPAEPAKGYRSLGIPFETQLLIRKIDLGFQLGHDGGERAAPTLDQSGQGAVELPQRLPPLGRRFGGDEIGETFDRGEVQAAIPESPGGEFAGLGGSEARSGCQAFEQGSGDGGPAMDVKLGHILAAEAVRARQPEDQAPVQGLACFRMAQIPDAGAPGRGPGPG